MTEAGEMTRSGLGNGTIAIVITIEIVITGTKTVVIIADANTLAQAPPANHTESTIEVVRITDAETPTVLQKKEAATTTPLILTDIDHQISLKKTLLKRLLNCSNLAFLLLSLFLLC